MASPFLGLDPFTIERPHPPLPYTSLNAGVPDA
jgi:hypothetical protein